MSKNNESGRLMRWKGEHFKQQKECN